MTDLKEVIREFRDGCHGESELRAVAEYLHDNYEPSDPHLSVRLCDYLVDAAGRVKAELEKALAEPDAD